MKLFALTALTMLAFAANSLLNRLALVDGAIGPGGFAAVRVASGLAVLLALVALRDRGVPRVPRPHIAAVIALTAYMLGFSHAYVSMDAGLGALVLFGGVQLTMFLGALAEGGRPPLQHWAGMGLSMVGLAVLTLPSGPVEIPTAALALMASGAVGWGVYSLIGRGATDPLAATAWNFAWSLPLVLIALVLLPDSGPATARGLGLAALSGGVTSGLGYALWYTILPKLGATRAALSQLSAPVIALALGAVLLGEVLASVALLAAAMILGGIGLGLIPARTVRN